VGYFFQTILSAVPLRRTANSAHPTILHLHGVGGQRAPAPPRSQRQLEALGMGYFFQITRTVEPSCPSRNPPFSHGAAVRGGPLRACERGRAWKKGVRLVGARVV
jgi:hypothetical protein